MKTIKDIANEANVSTGTVDRVIHSRPGVSLKTQEKIQKLLDKYNFETNLLASTLASKKKYVMVAIIPSSSSNKEYWHGPLKGLRAAFKEIKKYRVEAKCMHFNQFDQASYEECLKQVLEINPDGVVFAPFFYKTSLDFTKLLNQRNIPYVFINIDLEIKENLSYIGQDSYQGGYLCAKMMNLCTKENSHLAILLSQRNLDNHRAIASRVKGFVNYFSEEKAQREIKKIYFKNLELNQVREVLTKVLTKDSQIKGLFVPSSFAYVVAQFLESIAHTKMHIIGFDAHENNAEYIKKGLIDFVIDQNPFDQGYLSVKILFKYLLSHKKPNVKYNSPMTLITTENIDYFKGDSIEFIT